MKTGKRAQRLVNNVQHGEAHRNGVTVMRVTGVGAGNPSIPDLHTIQLERARKREDFKAQHGPVKVYTREEIEALEAKRTTGTGHR